MTQCEPDGGKIYLLPIITERETPYPVAQILSSHPRINLHIRLHSTRWFASGENSSENEVVGPNSCPKG